MNTKPVTWMVSVAAVWLPPPLAVAVIVGFEGESGRTPTVEHALADGDPGAVDDEAKRPGVHGRSNRVFDL